MCFNNAFKLLLFLFEIASLLHNQTPPPPPPQSSQQQTQQQQQQQLPNNVAAAVAAAANQPRNIHNVQTHEMNIPNDLIGCIIGRGGQKISEIRYLYI